MRTYGYDTYRGRSKTRTFLTALAVLLAIVLALAVGFFLFAQRYIVYTDDGQAHLELPFLQKTTPPPSAAPVQSQDIIIITPEPAPTPTPDTTVKAVWLLRESITDGTVQEQVEDAGGNAVVFNMKADDGTLGYISDLPQAIAYGASDATVGINDKIKAITAGELYTVARVSCFKDNKAPRMDNALAIKTNSGYNWQDPEGRRWMNVTVPEAREYVIGVCRELAGLGFDEILLENSGYPTEGNLHYIKKGSAYDTANLTGPVAEFYAEMAQAMEEYPGVKLSFSAGAGVLGGEGDLSGQTPELLGQYAQRLYVPAPEKANSYAAALARMGLEEAQVTYLTDMEGAATASFSTLVKPWEVPEPALTPPPSLPTATPTPTPSGSPEPSPSPSPTASPTRTVEPSPAGTAKPAPSEEPVALPPEALPRSGSLDSFMAEPSAAP